MIWRLADRIVIWFWSQLSTDDCTINLIFTLVDFEFWLREVVLLVLAQLPLYTTLTLLNKYHKSCLVLASVCMVPGYLCFSPQKHWRPVFYEWRMFVIVSTSIQICLQVFCVPNLVLGLVLHGFLTKHLYLTDLLQCVLQRSFTSVQPIGPKFIMLVWLSLTLP